MIVDAKELKSRYLKRIAGMRDNKVYIGPEELIFEITNACNLRCQYCLTVHAHGDPAHLEKANFFPWDKFIEIVSDCVELKVDQIEILGSGEPTVHPLFKDMMDHLEHQPLRVKLFTNATFSPDFCESAIKSDFVVVNLSAVNRQQYLDLKGKDLFDRVVANIERLVYLRDTSKPGFHVQICYIINALNVNQQEKMQELADKLRVNSVFFQKMHVHDYNRRISLPEGPSGDVYGEIRRTPGMCLNGWFTSIINLNNYFTTCEVNNKMGVFDFTQSSFKQFWLSSQLMEIRLQGKFGHTQKKFKACESCHFYNENIKRMKLLNQMSGRCL